MPVIYVFSFVLDSLHRRGKRHAFGRESFLFHTSPLLVFVHLLPTFKKKKAVREGRLFSMPRLLPGLFLFAHDPSRRQLPEHKPFAKDRLAVCRHDVRECRQPSPCRLMYPSPRYTYSPTSPGLIAGWACTSTVSPSEYSGSILSPATSTAKSALRVCSLSLTSQISAVSSSSHWPVPAGADSSECGSSMISASSAAGASQRAAYSRPMANTAAGPQLSSRSD